MSYVSTAGSAGAPCIFCDALAAGDDRRALVLHRGESAFLILNAFPYASAHLMAAPRRHVAALEEAQPEELTACMTLLQASIRAIRAVYGPDGFNLGVNQGRVAGAGVLGHLHVHLVPRWAGDTNFMPVVGQTRVLPEDLETTYDRLRPALARELP
jgi:ATP adenylyltransferase